MNALRNPMKAPTINEKMANLKKLAVIFSGIIQLKTDPG
jgi:hypothetical protein